MLKSAVGLGLLVLFFGPAAFLVGVGVLLNPSAQASCLPGAGVPVAQLPNRLVATTADGTAVTLSRSQLVHAATVITVGGRTPGVDRTGIKVALMAALTESSLKMLANSTAYPESASLPHDGDGSDHDSLGMFQMRPSTGWGTVQQLMDPDYQARAFFGGPHGPNHGSPRGLLDIPGWQQLAPDVATQSVEVSAFPDRYTNFEPVAEAILRTLTSPDLSGADGGPVPVAESTRMVFPLPAGTWIRTDTFGPRIDPVTGEPSVHTGVDYAAAAGTPILAVADGRVVFAGPVSSGYAHLILIQHTIGGARTVISGYAHMYRDAIHVQENQIVAAGQHIADVGADGKATGPHLHFEIRLGGPSSAAIDPERWLTGRGAAHLPPGSSASQAACGADSPTQAAPYASAAPNRFVDDPTSPGRITARTAYVLAQIQAHFPSSSWACWREGDSRSEHPVGRACDGTFGNTIGEPARGHALTLGWRVTNWLKANAHTLGVEYLIWQGRIWSVARGAEGWRPYGGGGMHDAASVTGGHFDHQHWTAVNTDTATAERSPAP